MLVLTLLALQVLSCMGQGLERSGEGKSHPLPFPLPRSSGKATTFPQIHTNLNGMVREFVRTMYQDSKGTYWFGTNGDGIIRYDGRMLEPIQIQGVHPHMRVMDMVEDEVGHIWFGTSEGLVQFDGEQFRVIPNNGKSPGHDGEIWSMAIDGQGLMWIGSTTGVSQFDGQGFQSFPLPDSKVKNPRPMLSDDTVFKILIDDEGTIWIATDGNGIFQYSQGEFHHWTAENGLPDNNVADILQDRQGNIWIGTFYGGVSKFDGKTFVHFTEAGIIEGQETYNFLEDSQGNIWFTAEGFGVYRYDGKDFTQFTTKDGLTTHVVQHIFEDHQGQLWFGTWQGLCIFDGEQFVDAREKMPWTN